MDTKTTNREEKEIYVSPKVLATYNREELEDAIGIEPEGQTGGLCGCGCGCSSGGCG